MSRPASIQDAALLAAARRVFLKHGYTVGTARIAREAGVSEGSLFKRFKTKADLFMAAMEVGLGEQGWQQRLEQTVGVGDIRDALEFTGRQLLKRLRTVFPCIMMVRSSGIVFAGACQGDRVPPPIQHIRTLARFFRAECKQGRLVMEAPEVQAHIFLGALSHYVFCETIIGHRTAPAATYIRTLVDNILRSAAPGGAPADARNGRRPRHQKKGPSP